MKKQILILIILCTALFVFTGCSSGSSHYRDGMKSLEAGNYEQSAASFRKALENNSNRAEYHLAYGLTLIYLEKWEEAIGHFDRVYMDKNIRMIQKNNQRALRGKGIAYYFKKDYEEALQQFEAALDIGVLPKLNLDILYYQGAAMIHLGNYEGAIEIYTGILDKKEDAEILAKRAFAYHKLGSYDKSLEDFDRAVALDEGNYELYFGKYKALAELGNTAEAQKVLDTAAQIKVKTKEDQYQLAKVHYYQGNLDAALTEFTQSDSEGFKEANYYIGEIHQSKGDFPTAIHYYEKFIEEGSGMNQLPVHNQIASCLIKQQNYDLAIKYLEQGIASQSGENARILRKHEIIAYENTGRFDMALEKLEEYLKDYPQDSEALREKEFLLTRQ